MSGQGGVIVLVDLYYSIEKPVYALAASAYGGYYGHAEQVSQGDGVQLVSSGLQLVVHVEGHDHPEVHVYYLGGEVEVPFQIGCIHDVDDHVRDVVYEVFPYIQFFRAVRGQGVCAGKVYKHEPVAFVFESAFLGVDRDAAVVPYTFVGA